MNSLGRKGGTKEKRGKQKAHTPPIFATVKENSIKNRNDKKVSQKAQNAKRAKGKGIKNSKRVIEDLENKKRAEEPLFTSSRSCKNATGNATLTGAIDVKQFKQMKDPHKEILIYLWKKRGKTLQSEIVSHLGRDKSTVSRYFAYLTKKGLISVQDMGIYKEYELSISGESWVKALLQFLMGYELDKKTSLNNLPVPRAHALKYETRLRKIPSKLLPKKRGTHEVLGWKVWNMANNYHFMRQYQVYLKRGESLYSQTATVEFMYVRKEGQLLFITIPEIYDFDIEGAQKTATGAINQLLSQLKDEGFKFTGGKWHTTETTFKSGHIALMGDDIARLMKAKGIRSAKSKNFEVDSSVRIEEREGVGERAIINTAREFTLMEARAQCGVDKKGNEIPVSNPIEAEAMAWENKMLLEDMEKVSRQFMGIANENFKQISELMDFQKGGLPVPRQIEMMRQNAELANVLKEIRDLLKELKR